MKIDVFSYTGLTLNYYNFDDIILVFELSIGKLREYGYNENLNIMVVSITAKVLRDNGTTISL